MFSPPFQAKLSTSIKFLAKAQSKLKMHLPFVHLPWNTMPVPPQFCIHCTFVFYFSWVFQSSQEKLKTMHMHGGKTRCTTVDVQVVNDNVIRTMMTCCCCSSNKKQSIPSEMKISDVVAMCIWACRERINLQVIFYFFNCLIHIGDPNSITSKLHVETCRFFSFHKEWVKYAFLIQWGGLKNSAFRNCWKSLPNLAVLMGAQASNVWCGFPNNILDQVNKIISIVAFPEPQTR